MEMEWSWGLERCKMAFARVLRDYDYYVLRNEKATNLIKKIIDEINDYPKNSEFTLGYYISEFAGYSWVPFPYMEMLQNLHLEDKKDPINSHLSHWIRHQPATWKNGVVPAVTITIAAPDNVIFTSSSGETAQLHDHIFPAFTGTPDIYVVNNFAVKFVKVTDLNTQLTDSVNGSMANKFFSLVIWGVQSQSESDCKLMCNLPRGSYNTQSGLIADASKFTDFSIPSNFVGTAFLIAQLQLRHQNAAGGTWTEIDTIDLRGLIPSIAPGGSTAGQTEFIDNTFRILDQTDSTQEIAFEASSITTATTRTITMADRDVDLDRIMPTIETAGGLTMVVNTKYIANAGLGIILTLPVTIAQGNTVTVLGKGVGGWTVGQNAGQTIHDVAGDTTPGVGGSYASTNRYDCVTLECITADTDFVVRNSEGAPNIT